MKDYVTAIIFGVSFGATVTFCGFGIVYIETKMENNAIRRFENAYQEGVLAGKNNLHDNFNPYDSVGDNHFRTEWRRGYNKGLIERNGHDNSVP